MRQSDRMWIEADLAMRRGFTQDAIEMRDEARALRKLETAKAIAALLLVVGVAISAWFKFH